jgi:hypothetical protein
MYDLNKRLSHHCFPQPEDPLSYVWRYMPLATFVLLLKTSQLYFARMDLLDDPYEGSLPNRYIKARNVSYKEHGLEQFLPGTMSTDQKIRQMHYVSCWALMPSESVALWHLYTYNVDGIAIQTTYQALVDIAKLYDHLYVGKVSYLDYETELFSDDNLFQRAMHKRRIFEHEREVRMLKTEGSSFSSSNIPPPGLLVSIKLESLIHAIYIAPYAQPWYMEAVKAIVDKFAPSLCSHIFQSKINNKPLG